jgi:DNA-binding NtrC family response regulator
MDTQTIMLIMRPGSIRDGVQILLTSINHIANIEVVEDVLAGLKRLGQAQYSLVILESFFPEIGVDQVMMSIKAISPLAKCILLTEKSIGQTDQEPLQFDAIIQYGTHPNTLVAIIERLISASGSKGG